MAQLAVSHAPVLKYATAPLVIVLIGLQGGLYEPRACEGHKGSVYALALNEAGNFLAAGSTDGAIRISDARSNTIVASFKGHTENIRCPFHHLSHLCLNHL